MSRRNVTWIISLLVFTGIGAAVGIAAWIYIDGGSSTPSEPISAPTLDLNAEPTFSQTEAAALATENAALQQTAAAQLANTATPEPTEAPAETAEQSSGEPERTLFRIESEDSEARFQIDEILRGNPTTVVGRTSEVAGDIIVNFDDPSQSQIGTIRINMRNLETPNEFRNRALRSDILESNQDEFEFSEFVPTALENISSDPVVVGDTLRFDIVGDLTVRDVTRSITFSAVVTLVSEGEISGLAATTIQYPDFGLTIPPNVPGVTDVSETVILEIEFEALAVDA